MNQPRNLADYLNAAGIKVAAAPSTTPVVAAPSKVAAKVEKKADVTAKAVASTSDASSQPSTEPTAGKKPRETNESAAVQDTGKTAAQIWLAERGVDCKDAKTAEFLLAQQVKMAEEEKYAEMEKNAEELRSQGAIMLHGMQKESAAQQFACGEIDINAVSKLASMIFVSPASIVKRAEEIAAAVGTPALVGTDLGRAARTNDSRTMSAAEQNGNTTSFQPEAAGETRAPVSGQDAKTMRFVDIWNLPGNPGLNHGQAVDQGKALQGE